MNKYEMLKPSFVVAGKVRQGDKLTRNEYTRLGRYWWFWVPRLITNDGSFRRGSAWVSLTVQWLCFSLNFDWVRK